MNRSSKFNFFLPQNTDPIDVSDFNSNFETIDANLLTKAQNLTETQKSAVRANVDLNVANNLTTSAAGSVLDARQGNALKGLIDALQALVEPHGLLANETNFNDVKDPGAYYCGSANTYPNIPSGETYGFLVVHKASDSKVMQFFVSPTKIYRRILTDNNGTWGTWYTDSWYGGNLAGGALSEVKIPGVYAVPSSATFSDKPANDVYTMLVMRPVAGSSHVVQIAWSYTRFYWRYIYGSTVRPWQQTVDTKVFAVSPASSETLTVSNNTRAMLVLTGARDAICGTIVVSATSGGVISVSKTGAASVNVTVGTNALTLQNTITNVTLNVYAQVYLGDIT